MWLNWILLSLLSFAAIASVFALNGVNLNFSNWLCTVIKFIFTTVDKLVLTMYTNYTREKSKSTVGQIMIITSTIFSIICSRTALINIFLSLATRERLLLSTSNVGTTGKSIVSSRGCGFNFAAFLFHRVRAFSGRVCVAFAIDKHHNFLGVYKSTDWWISVINNYRIAGSTMRSASA